LLGFAATVSSLKNMDGRGTEMLAATPGGANRGLEEEEANPAIAFEVISRVASTLEAQASPALAADDADAATASDAARRERGLRILLAEDSPDSRILMKSYLKRLPYQIVIAENGKLAVEKFRRGNYDLVLIDMQMPVMDGYEAVQRIREFERRSRRLSPTPIIAMTASMLDRDVHRAFDAGCSAFIPKPVRKAALFEAISETLAAAAATPAAAQDAHVRIPQL
jgi:CheY-like chemotaxis protein